MKQLIGNFGFDLVQWRINDFVSKISDYRIDPQEIEEE